MSQQDQVSGHLMRGADGRLYFIPHDDLASFQVPEDQAPHVEAMAQGNAGPEEDTVSFSEASLQVVAHVQVPTSTASVWIQQPPE